MLWILKFRSKFKFLCSPRGDLECFQEIKTGWGDKSWQNAVLNTFWMWLFSKCVQVKMFIYKWICALRPIMLRPHIRHIIDIQNFLLVASLQNFILVSKGIFSIKYVLGRNNRDWLHGYCTSLLEFWMLSPSKC